MKTRTKFAVVDVIFNYVLFTPLVLLFWYGTYALIDQLILSRFESRIVGGAVTLAVGLSVEFIVTYWQDAFCSRGRYHASGLPFIVYSRLYNYVLAVANICHYRAIQEFYDIVMTTDDGQPGGLVPALQTAVTSIVLLWSMRAGRNITAIPFAVSVDTTDPESWFSAPTLYQSSPSRRVRHLLDTIVTVAVVWTLGPLHWITLGYVFDAVVFPDDYNMALITSCVVGYASVGLFTLLQTTVKELSHHYERDGRFAVMTVLEDVYIFAATASVILTWKGVGMAVDLLARQFPVQYMDYDVTGLCANVASFLLLSMCYVTGSLVGKGAEMDGANSGGAGVEFSTAYFGHFFDDFIRERDREEDLTTQKSKAAVDAKKVN
jgi:hypothetical protein